MKHQYWFKTFYVKSEIHIKNSYYVNLRDIQIVLYTLYVWHWLKWKKHLNSTDMKFTWKIYLNFVSVDNFQVNFTCSNFSYVIKFN